jgi:hypothetical protein
MRNPLEPQDIKQVTAVEEGQVSPGGNAYSVSETDPTQHLAVFTVPGVPVAVVPGVRNRVAISKAAPSKGDFPLRTIPGAIT